MNHQTYYHYGASVIHAPITHLRQDMHTILNIPPDALRATAAVEQATDHRAGSHVLIYRSIPCAPQIAEYSVTCTLTCVAETPPATLVEWMREYRPEALVGHDQLGQFVSAQIEQDRAISSRLAADYASCEVFYIDYTLGGA